MTRESIPTIFTIVILSTLLILSTRSGMPQYVSGKNNNIDLMSSEDDSCRYQTSQIDSLCQAEKSNIQNYDTNAMEHNSKFGNPETRMDTFMKHYDEYQAEELGTNGFDQNGSVSNTGNTNSNETVMPALAGHNGGGGSGNPGTGNGGGHNGGGGSGNPGTGNGGGHNGGGGSGNPGTGNGGGHKGGGGNGNPGTGNGGHNGGGGSGNPGTGNGGGHNGGGGR